MGASLIDIKKRIDSTAMTKQITSAMQMVAASKLNRSEQHARQFQEYASKIHEIVEHIAADLQADGIDFDKTLDTRDAFIDFRDMLIERPVKKTGYLIVSACEGLAGSYNSSLFQSTLKMLQEDHVSHDEYVLLAIGSQANSFFEKAGIKIDYQIGDISDFPTFEEVHSIIEMAISMFREGVFDALYVCYNHHVNAMMSIYRAEHILPFSDLGNVEYHDAPIRRAEYLFEPSKEAVLATLLPQYVESMIYGMIIDAKTAEHAARMNAMRQATDNATDLIDTLHKQYHQQRQAAITQEITEIVSGAAAQNGENESRET